MGHQRAPLSVAHGFAPFSSHVTASAISTAWWPLDTTTHNNNLQLEYYIKRLRTTVVNFNGSSRGSYYNGARGRTLDAKYQKNRNLLNVLKILFHQSWWSNRDTVLNLNFAATVGSPFPFNYCVLFGLLTWSHAM